MKQLQFSYSRERIFPGFDGVECKIYPRMVRTEGDNVFLTYSMLLLSGSDVFNDSYFAKSTDGGVTFGQPEKMERLETWSGGIRTITAASTEYYSAHHGKWFGFGRETSYSDDVHPIMQGGIATGKAIWMLRDTQTGHFTGEVREIPVPIEYISATPHAQIVEYENGDFLLTYYIVPAGKIKAEILAVRYAYEGGELRIVEAGGLLDYPAAARGLDEPSVAKLGGRYYMTLRTDEQGLLAVSEDGLHYSEPAPWKWDDGTVLENYNTMQRWIRHRDGLYLAYTRKGANNDHVFRHRAPIFMARFDEENMCLVRETEVILVPELGARLGNFNVTEVSEKEFWLLTTEWMQPVGCERYGSDNAIWRAKIEFED